LVIRQPVLAIGSVTNLCVTTLDAGQPLAVYPFHGPWEGWPRCLGAGLSEPAGPGVLQSPPRMPSRPSLEN